MEKITNVKALSYVLENAELPAEIREKVEKMKAQFEKKNSAEKKPTAVQVANESIKANILNGMEIGKKYTITDLMKEIPACAELSNQRVSALVRQLVIDKAVERTEEKRKAYFHKVA